MDAVLELQQAYGNQAVVQLLGAASHGTPPTVVPGLIHLGNRGAVQLLAIQREKNWYGAEREDEDSPKKVDPGALVLKPDDNGKPAGEMTWNELQAAIDENESVIKSAIQSTPDILRREKRLVDLRAAQDKLGKAAAGGGDEPKRGRARGGKKAPPKEMPPKPISLTESRDWSKEPAGLVKREMDMVVAYLAAHPKKAEREILMRELPSIEAASGALRNQHQMERHVEQMTQALSPKGGTEGQQLDELLRRLQQAQKDPSQEDTWLIHYEGQVVPVSTGELEAVRTKVGEGLMQARGKIYDFEYDIEDAWKTRTEHNRSHSRTHALVKFATGADDIPASDIENMNSTGRMYYQRIKAKVAAGDLIGAGDDLQAFDINARYWADKVGKWETELMKGAGRWVLGLTIMKEALSILAGFGAANLAKVAGAGSTIATFKAGAQLAGMTTAVGGASGYLGSKVAGMDTGKGTRAGLGAGFGVGSSALTAGVGTYANMGKARQAATLGGKAWEATKAVGLETGANVATSSTQALIEGGDVKKAALGAVVATPITTLGGGAVDSVAKSKAVAVAGKTAVGLTAGYASSKATDQDALHGTLLAGGGAFYGAAATPFEQPAGGGGRELPPGNDSEGGGGGGGGTRKTLIGTGIDPREPGPTTRKTLIGTGIDPREPAEPNVTLGTGIEPRKPAMAAPKLGTGIEPRRPAARAAPGFDPHADTIRVWGGDPNGTGSGTLHGMGVAPETPGPGGGGGTSPGMGNAGPGTPKPAAGPVSQFATLDEYRGKPIEGDVAHVITNADEAKALYRRVSASDRRPSFGTEDADIEKGAWNEHGGKGDPPMAWVRARDGAVRFNFSAFERPNLGGHSAAPMNPIRMPGSGNQDSGTSGGKPIIQEWARLPEFVGKTPIFGPRSRVAQVITDREQAQRLYDQLVKERQLHILEYPESVGSLRWSEHGGVGEVPLAWITTDGVIRFTTEKFRPGAVIP